MNLKFIFLYLFLSCLMVFSQQTKLIALRVDVLGKKHETVRYYHPIEGNYNVMLSNYINDKKTADLFSNCIFIDPRLQLKDSLTHVQANSLRHYCDPSELIYIDWQWDSDTSNVQDLERFKINSERIREKKYQNQINDYFRPFYFKTEEVSNKEYREFVYWVRDSLFKEAIYHSDEFTDEEVFEMLNATTKTIYYHEEEGQWKTAETSNREENRAFFSFRTDFNIWEEFPLDRLLPELENFYLRPNERWYKRREPDVTKLTYRYYYWDLNVYNGVGLDTLRPAIGRNGLRSHRDLSEYLIMNQLPVYPDTLGWIRDSRYQFNEPFSNMYFWHPAYDNYPVVGISWDQAKAFCHWKEQQLYAAHPELENKFTIDLPTVYEYENVISVYYEHEDHLIIQDNEILTNLLLDNSTGESGLFHELFLRNEIPFTHKVNFPFDQTNTKAKKRFDKYARDKYEKKRYPEYKWSNHLYNILLMRASQNYLKNGVRFLSNNTSEWMSEDYETHYEELFKAYINYHCFASIDYCEHQRIIDQNLNNRNPAEGKLIMGSNWFDERYEMIFGVNIAGLYAKRFEHAAKSHSTVGFRYVVRLK